MGKPRLEFWALRADLREPGLRIVVNDRGTEEWPGNPDTPAAEGAGNAAPAGLIPSTRVSGFVEAYNCLAGINTNPFSPVSAKVGERRSIDGLAIADGTLVSLPNPHFDALVFYRDPESGDGDSGIRAAIVSQALLGMEEPQQITHAAGGFHIVLRDGLVPESVEKRSRARHPRSAAGLSPDGRTLYLLVVDGRRLGSIGVTETELGVMLKRLGASEGLNFDGGGSSVLALRYGDGKVRPVNTPIHRGIPGRERGVATCLGIRAEP